MSNIENILLTQNQLKEEIEKLLRNFKKDGGERKTPLYIKKRLEVLDSYWTEFQTNHTLLYQHEDHDYSYFAENHYQLTRDFYSEARTFIQKYEISEIAPAAKKREKSPAKMPSIQITTTKPSGEPSTSQQQQFNSEKTSTYVKTKSQGNASKSEELLRKQKSNFKAFTRTLTTINIEQINEKWEFEDTLKNLEARWKTIDTLHWEIDSEATVDDEYDQIYEIYEQQYNAIKKAINTKMWSVSHKEKSTPKMDLPTFSGAYQHWTSFKDLFTEVIHDNGTLSSAQKMQYLKSKVKGEAEKLIQHLSISSENYQVCWDILNNRYNNKKLIFTSHLNTILNLPVIQYQTATNIKRIHDTTNECLNAIKKLDVDISTWDPILVHLLSQKLDTDSYNDYIEAILEPRELPNLAEFMRFLEAKFTSLESVRRKQDRAVNDHQQQRSSAYQTNNKIQSTNRAPNYQNYQNFNVKPKAYTNNAYNSTWKKGCVPRDVKCPLCKNEHGLFHCNDFFKLQTTDRRSLVTKHNLCKNCLFDHKGQQCKSDKRCIHCNSNHHTLLHDKSMPVSAKNMDGPNVSIKKNDGPSTNASIKNISETLLATAQVKVRTHDGCQVILRALIDQGSQISIVTENTAQLLGLPRLRRSGVIFGIGTKENNCKGAINLTCTSTITNNNFTFDTQVYVMKNLVNNLPSQSFSKPFTWTHLEGIQLADPDFNISRPIDILFGADVYSNIILGGIIKGDDTQPMAQQSQLGWILCGNIKSFQCNVVLNNLEDIRRFWEIEDIAECSQMSSEDAHCLQQYKTETKRQENGRYVVRLPLHSDIDAKLGESKPKATAQFLQLEKRFRTSEHVAKHYKLFMSEYEELNHMQLCKNNNMKPSFYLPHHCVQRAESKTTPLRVIFNASAKTTTGLSLNDLMYRGPNLQTDLLSLILKWRQYKIAITADIEKHFRQILCHEKDQTYQKILWRSSPDQLLREYTLTTVAYGTKAAPFLAMMTLKQLANDERHNFPEAAAILETSFYMDDLLCSTDSIQSAIKLKKDLTKLLKSGGFNLRKWSSNEAQLLHDEGSTSNIPEAYCFRNQETTKTLGLRWNPNEDNFTFQLTINTTSTNTVTKRTLLSEISKIFDPLGWLSPVTTKLKLIFQAVWKEEQRWDDNVPEHVNKEWEKVKTQLTEINNLKIPRWLEIKQIEDIELHGFCDASISAYSCIIYNKTKQGSVIIVAAKSRLVPAKKTITLPRLELCAALLLSTLMKSIIDCLSSHNLTLVCWSDSTAVLGWLQGDQNRWNVFVCNRVQKIKEIIPPYCWHYVKSADNPADCASRGILPSQLKSHPLWWSGPEWLSTYTLKEGRTKGYETDEEMIKLQTNVTTTNYNHDFINELLKRNSCLTRVTRVIAWILRFATRNERPNYLTTLEIKKARSIVLKNVQHNYFKEEITNLKLNKEIDRRSKLLPLNPYLDEEGILRVGGRINNAYIDAEQKNPIIVPHNGHYTEMLIDHTHKNTFHGGARVTSARLRKQYWIIGGNRAVKKRIFNCVKCRRHNPIQQTQLMGDLPAPRCNPTRPFYHSGVDYTGYIDVKTNKGRGSKTTKGYVAVFVCMVTKAVHLELVSDLTSTAFLAALRRLSARRGAPRHIHSDNATNFTGSNNSLKQEFIDLKRTLDPEFFSAITDMNIEWHFIAPSWPSAGGLWEGAVKSLKFHLRRVLGEQKLTYEELSTLLAELEACLNSRPLLALTEDPEDIDYLTPSHFLSSGPTLTIIETETDLRTRWQLVQKIFKDIWKRWQSEYLTQLSPRGKWQQRKLNMNINDLVVIHDSNLPAGKWALGRVVDLHGGKDGCVRVVSVRTKNGIMKRPITKLSKLPVTKSAEEDGQVENKNNETEDEQNKRHNNEEITRNKNKRTRRRAKLSCNLIWAILTMFTFMAPVRCDFSLTNINANQSIYFDKVTDIHLIRDEWKLIVYYDMNPYWQGIQAFKSYITTLQKTCSNTEKHNQCDIIVLQLRHGYSELMHYSDLLLDQKLKPTRQRRGLIDGVGYIANSLFGILDEHFAEKYEKDIDSIQTNEKHLAQLWKNQTSVLEAENNIMKRVEQSIEKQYKMYTQHINALDKASITLATEINDVKINNDFTLMSIIANNILVNLKGLQDTLLETITEIHYGKLNIHLLNPQQLTGELNIISGLLSKDLTIPVENIQTDLPKLYHLLKVKARMTPKYFIFEIKIPLITRDSYEIYKLIAVPQLILNKTMMSILPIADYVAINLQKDAYITMTENELRICTPYNFGIMMCSLQRPIHHLKTEDNLCEKNVETEKCKTKQTICRDVWIELNTINTYMYFCCEQRTIRIICKRQVTAERVSKAGIIRLGNGCVIKGEAFTIYSHMQQSNHLTIQPDDLKVDVPPINNIFNITVPNNEVKMTNDEELITYNNQLNRIGDQIKQMKNEGDDVAEHFSSHDVHQFVVLYLLAGAALLAAGIYLWRRSRARCSATLPVVTSEPAIQLVQLPTIPMRTIPTSSGTSMGPASTPENSMDQHYARVDKATSPTTRKLFSASDSVK